MRSICWKNYISNYSTNRQLKPSNVFDCRFENFRGLQSVIKMLLKMTSQSWAKLSNAMFGPFKNSLSSEQQRNQVRKTRRSIDYFLIIIQNTEIWRPWIPRCTLICPQTISNGKKEWGITVWFWRVIRINQIRPD